MATQEPGHGGIENGRCFAEAANNTSPPLFQNGTLTFQAHHVGWIVAGFFASVAVVTAFWLIDKHLIWYYNKAQQRQIVRLLLMVPIYAVVSFISYIYWNHATAIVLIRDCYESFVLYSFFYLLLLYLADDPMEQREIFKHVKLDKWMFPLGWVKWRPEDGLYFLQLMKWGVLQYSILRPLCTLASVGLNYMGLYCEISWSPAWGHIYLTGIISISVTVAMYCLFQLYFAVKGLLAPQKPLLKLFSIKAVVFLTFWQATFLGLLASFGLVKDTKYMTAEDINIGIGAILETFEMMMFAFLYVKAFPYHPYKALSPDGKRTPRMRGIRHAFWYRDLWKELKDGTIYLWRRMRGKEAEKLMRKQIHLENAMGRSRRMDRGPGGAIRPQPTRPKEGMPAERPELPWLNIENDGLNVDVELELEKRGLSSQVPAGSRGLELQDIGGVGHSRKQASWWRRAYDRVSGRGSADEQYAELHSPKEKLRSPRLPRHELDEDDVDIDPLDQPPPPSIILKNRKGGAGSGYSQVASDEPDEDGRRRDRRKRRDGGRGGSYVPQRSQPIAPIDFTPTAEHHRDDGSPHPLRVVEAGVDLHSTRPPPLPEMSRSPPPEAARRPAELSRSPPPRAAMLTVPAPPESIARSDSLLGRVFARRAPDETVLSHGDGMTDGALSRSMSLASDARHMQEVEPLSIAAVIEQAPPVEGVAPDASPEQHTSVDAGRSSTATRPTRHRVDATLPPLPPPSPDRNVESALDRLPEEPDTRIPVASLPPVTDAQSPLQHRSPNAAMAQRYSVPVGPPPRVLPRPKELVMPTPLSPARYPGDSPNRGQTGDNQRSSRTAQAIQGPGPSDLRSQQRRHDNAPPSNPRRQGPPLEESRGSRSYDPRYSAPPVQSFALSGHHDGVRNAPPPPRESYRQPQKNDYDPRRRDFSPQDRGRPLQRGADPRYLQRIPPPPLPGLDYLPSSPSSAPHSPPHAAMFPTSPIASPERGPYPSHPNNGSPGRVMRLPRDDVPSSGTEYVRGRSSMSVDPVRDIVGPKHPRVQQHAAASSARRSTLDPTMQYAPVSPGQVLRPADMQDQAQARRDRRQSAPVGYGQPQPPPQRYLRHAPDAGATGRAPQPRGYSDAQRPPGAAAPYVSGFPETISPTPIRPSPNHVTNLTPAEPDPTTGLVPYVPRAERARNAGDTARAPWT